MTTRTITFRPNGDIRIMEHDREYIISQGVMLLTREQANEAKQHGWVVDTEEPHVDANDPPLYRVRRMIW